MRTICLPAFILLLLSACATDSAPPAMNCENERVTYSGTIGPLIVTHCYGYGCHNQGATIGDFTTYQGLKAKIDNGSFRLRVLDLKVMPPYGHTPLSDLELFRIRCWLEAGAPEN